MPERHRSHRQPHSIAASDAWDHRAGDGASRVDPRAFGLLKAAYSVAETLELLSVGRTSLYAAVKRGDLTPIKFGRKTLFCAMDLAAFLMRLKDEAAVSHTVGVRRRRA